MSVRCGRVWGTAVDVLRMVRDGGPYELGIFYEQERTAVWSRGL